MCGIPNNAVAIAYGSYDPSNEDHLNFLVKSFQDTSRGKWPSLRCCDKWLSWKAHALLENSHAYFGMSAYRGLVAYWISPKDIAIYGLAENWCKIVSGDFVETFNEPGEPDTPELDFDF